MARLRDTANNGNVASIANNRSTGRSQSFTYDEQNRIKTAQRAAHGAALIHANPVAFTEALA